MSGAASFLVGGGEMGALMRAKDWSATSLGDVSTWPQSLRTAVGMMLPSRAQIVLFWGPEFLVLYNDAYRPVFGAKHPLALDTPRRKNVEIDLRVGPLQKAMLVPIWLADA